MTALLLDTHALLWLLLDPERLSGPTLQRARDARTDVVVSAASAWEISTKHRLGRLGEAAPVVHGYAEPSPACGRVSCRSPPCTPR